MILEKINELKKIREYNDLVKKRCDIITVPEIENMELLGCIHQIVKTECSTLKELSTYDYRHYFVAIVIFLYSPKSYMGDKIRVGIRDGIAKVLDTSPARVSNIFRIVRDWVIIYTEFRRGVEYLYGKVLDKLQYGV